ncbi:hypothetical protein [Microbacterium sp. LWH3-1.2]|uniref:hypothetical protein n=1 Tax=Microbacterium sp. LWH3-1.2 TaxID=3135256 RepID=UPI003419C948
MRIDVRRVVVVGLVYACALGLAGCTSPTAAAPSPSATSNLEALCADTAVALCANISDGIVVTVAEAATERETLELAGRLSELAAAASLDAGAVLERAAVDITPLDPEVSNPPRWRLPVYPGDSAEVEHRLRDILTVAAVPGTLGINVVDGWPSVTVASLDQFDPVFDAVSATPLFDAGGTYTLLSLDEQLRIVHVPDRTSNEAIHEIVDIARDYPTAEVLLEAPTAGLQFPTLYVARLTPEEVVQLDSRLRDPRLATADLDGYALSYVLASTGTDGTSYTNGTFGAVPTE